jgi:hypothetical protein
VEVGTVDGAYMCDCGALVALLAHGLVN